MISIATQDPYPNEFDYKEVRRELLNAPYIKGKLPDFVQRCQSEEHFWQFIKHEHPTYAKRRQFIWDSFAEVINYLEFQEVTPAEDDISSALENFDPENVHLIWEKALDRRANDPEGAITAARTLLETVCKHILDNMNVDYKSNADLPDLWRLCAKELNLSPDQHSEEAFKSILGGCHTIVQNLGTIRNKVSDAHGQGKRAVRPKDRHAKLAVNLAGSMATFLISTWEDKSTNV